MHENPVITNNKCQVRLKWCAWGMDYSESLLQFSQIYSPLTMGAVHSSCAHFKHTWHWIHRSRGLLSAKASPQTRHGQMSSSESSELSCLRFVRFLFPLVLGRFLFDPFPPPCFLDLLPVEVPGWGSLCFLGPFLTEVPGWGAVCLVCGFLAALSLLVLSESLNGEPVSSALCCFRLFFPGVVFLSAAFT